MNRYSGMIALLLFALMFFGVFAGQNTSALAEDDAIGSYVTFGTYPQSADGDDETPIEWLVLDRDGDKALLLSRYGLDAQPYNEALEEITWENCSLRIWLNDDFINRAFTTEEQAAILRTNVDNGAGQGFWSTANGGNNTQDKIFLLSYAEANRYLGVTTDDHSNMKSRVAPTAYAVAQGAWTLNVNQTEDGEDAGYWWLRSPGYSQDWASFVFRDGSLYDNGVHGGEHCVRPALWVSLASEIF